MRPFKILIIIDSLHKGGKERRLVELLKVFNDYSDLSIQVIIFKDSVSYREVLDLSNIRLHIFQRKIKKDPRIFWQFYRFCKTNKPDIIHSWGSMPTIYAIPTAKLLRIKLINAMITNAECNIWSEYWWRKKITFPFSDVILSNSRAGIDVYNVPSKKARVIYNGFNFSRLNKLQSADSIRVKFQIKNSFVVGMVGSFSETKDYNTLLLAAFEVLRKRKKISFVTIGNGPFLDQFKDMVPPEFIDKVHFLGNQDDVESIINVFSIGVLTTYTEGISNAIMEYMALAKPVIANRGGGTEELVKNNDTGFIIDQGSPGQLIQAIEYLMNNPGIAHIMGQKGKQRIVEKFSISNMADSTMNLYKELIKIN